MQETEYERIAQKITLPLVAEEDCEHGYALVDPGEDAGYGAEYGRITVLQDGSITLQLHNVISPKDEHQVMGYDFETVDYIQEGRRGEIEVGFVNGQVFICSKRPKHEEFRLAEECSFGKPSLSTIRYWLYHCFPDIRDRFVFDDVSKLPLVNAEAFGEKGKGWVVYQGMKSPYLTKIIYEMDAVNRVVQHGRKTGETEYLAVSKEAVDTVVKDIIHDHHVNGFIEDLRRIKWDGQRRVDSFFKTIGGFTHHESQRDSEAYMAIVMRMFLISVLQRNLEEIPPNIQFILVLMGDQNAGKSTFCSKMAFDKWHLQTIVAPDDEKKFTESVQGALVAELIEAVSLEGKKASQTKALIDRKAPRFRWAYAEMTDQFRVRYTMVATTNDMAVLNDPTGNRRFFPIILDPRKATKTIWAYTDEEIWQIWAEAYYLWQLGEKWNTHLYESDGITVRAMFKEAQEDITDPEYGANALTHYLDTTKSNLGDTVIEVEIENHLQNYTDMSSKQRDEVMNNFRHHYYVYGFDKCGGRRDYYDENGVRHQTRRVWTRVKEPTLVEDDSDVFF